MRYISRSSHDTFRECPRMGYWRYLSGPFGDGPTLGLQGAQLNKNLTLGTAWHMAAEKLLARVPAEEAVQEALKYGAANGLGEPELNWLLAAVLAWERVAAEEFFARYEVLSVEEELTTPITTNVALYTRADGILRDRVDGSVWVLNWKTAGDVKNWNRKWFYDIQSWTESLAAEAKLGIPVSGCLYYGIWKGPIWQGNISSRLIYGYKYTDRLGNVTYATENNGGGTRFSVWQETFPFGEGVTAWVNWLDPTFLKKCFVQSAPQIRQDELVEAWLRQVVAYESDVEHVLAEGSAEEKLDFFWQNWGDHPCGRCDFNALCTLKSTPEELIRDGFLKPRTRSPRDEMEGKDGLGTVGE
jgi:hypothetical protein